MAPTEPPSEITIRVKVPPGHLQSTTEDEFSLGSMNTSHTVSILRQRIQTLVPGNPAAITQRILYGGRALIDDGQTLAEVFNTKRDPSQLAYVVHLLIRNPNASHERARSTDASRVAPTANPAEGDMQATLQDTMNAHSAMHDLAAANARVPHHHHHHHHHPPQPRVRMSSTTPQPQPHPATLPPTRPISGQGFHFQGVRADGQHITIHQQTFAVPPNGLPGMQQHPGMPMPAQGLPFMLPNLPPATQQGLSALDRARLNMAELRTMIESLRNDNNPQSEDDRSQNLARMETRLREVNNYIDPFGMGGRTMPSARPPTVVADTPAEGLQTTASTTVQPGIHPLPHLQEQLQPHLRQTNSSPAPGIPIQAPFPHQQIRPVDLLRAQGLPPTAAPMWPNAFHPQHGQPIPGLHFVQGIPHNHGQAGLPDSRLHAHVPADETVVHLLSSPSGPEALVYSNQFGVFTSQPLTEQSHVATRAPLVTAEPTPTQPIQAQQQQPPADNAAPVAQQQQADANGMLQPILGHFWLLFRIIIFAYFLMGSNMGWRRPAALVLIGLGFWLIRMGLFANGGVLRRWWDGVVNVQNHRARPAQAQDAVAGNVAARPFPTPEELAQRLLQRRDDNAPLNRFREQIRPVERAVALFVASLWPGVGERYVEALDRARAEEEAAQRELLRQQQEAAAAAQAASEASQQTEKKSDTTGTISAETHDSTQAGESSSVKKG